jgi:hypothetical protein
MRKLSYFTTLFAMLFVAACSGSGEGFVGSGGGTGGTGGNIDISAVSVLVSSPSLPSDPGQSLDITVVVRDLNNVAVGGVTVIMSSDSGILTIIDPITDANGVVKAQINAGGDPTNRTITISADANGVVGSVGIDVLGTTLSLSGATALAQGDSAPYTIVLQDAGGNGISGQTVDISSATGNTLASTSLTTDVGGQAQVVLTASIAGADTLTATALGISATQDLSVSDDSFSLTAPLSGDEILLNTLVPVDLTWSIGGVPQVNQNISFSATRGTLSAFSALTNAAGVASVSISSTNAGASVITATNGAGTTTGVQVEFVADSPDSISVQASPFTIGPGEQSAVTAIVRDVANNLVKNEVVVFVLDDVTGGFLSVAQAITDSQGRAQTFYTASSTTSANNGVTVTASVQADPTISSFVELTVAQRELFMSIGTGNSIFEPNTAQYRVEFVVQVSDAQGNGVEGVPVQVGILSDFYHKGFWNYDQILSAWVQIITEINCPDEDANRDGVLDLATEDFNGSGRIEAGNIASAVPQNGSNGTFVSDAGGFGIIDIFYPQDHARWVDVTLEATTSVQGTEFASASSFTLPINGDDVDDEDESPPGINSPFGIAPGCGNTN